MRMVKSVLILGLAVSAFQLGTAAELGRQVVDAEPAATVSVQRNYMPVWFNNEEDPLGFALEVGVSLNKYSWDVEDHSFSDAAGALDVAAVYAVSQNLDIRAAIRYFKTDDELTYIIDEDPNPYEPDLSVFRLGVGARMWFPIGSPRLFPFVTGLIGYYAFDGKDLEDMDAGIGASIEGGLAYQIMPAALVRLSVSGETLLTECQGKIGPHVTDIDLSSIGAGIGVIGLF